MSDSKPSKEPLTILMAVDDEADNLAILTRTFGRIPGFRIHVAESGKDALEFLSAHRADILLVDQSMPVMNGVSFLQEATKIAPDAINIMVTGYPEIREVTDAQRLGLVQHIVPKPWKPQELIAMVRRALNMRDLTETITRVSKPSV